MKTVTLSPEQDAFWETIGPFLFSPERLADTAAEVEHIITLLNIHPPANVLDLCCGVGRHSLEFARRGFQVTGVDKTHTYLESASKQAEAEGLTVEFVHADMRTFRRSETFDVAVNLLTSFGYCETIEGDRQVALNVYHSLRSGGIFLLELMGKEVLARIFSERSWQEVNGGLLLQERQIGHNWEMIENRWIIVRGDSRIELRFSHRLYSAVELTALLSGCGFSRIEVYGDLAGSAYDHVAKRLVVVAQK